jgi:predicted ATPase
MLDWIRIQGFKSLHDVRVELAPLVVVVGPNAAGKSNFLEALLLLSRLGTAQTVAQAFEPPLRGYPIEAFSLPEGGLGGLLEQSSAGLSIHAGVSTASASGLRGAKGEVASPIRARYEVKIKAVPGTGEMEVAHEHLEELTRSGEPRRKGLPRIETSEGKLLVRQTGHAGTPRREELGLPHTLLSNRQFSGKGRYPLFDIMRQELASWRTYYLDPRIAMRAPQPPREVDDIGPQGEWIAPFLYRLKNSQPHRRHFDAVRRGLRAVVSSVESLDVDLDPRRGTVDILVRQDGTPYSSRVISEGTLRILALCSIGANPWPAELIAFEEPENGVHPRRIEVIAELLLKMARNRRCQVVVTTHSPTLAAILARRQREEPEMVRLVRAWQEDRATRLEPLQGLGTLFADRDIRTALRSPEDDDEGLLEAALLRGWLDG